MFILTENIRQKGSDQFQVLLDNLKYKKVTQADIDLLSTLLSNRLSVTEIENFSKGSVNLYGTKVECEVYNMPCLHGLEKEILKIPVKFSTPQYFCAGARVLLRNFWPQARITNGIQGTILGYLYRKKAKVRVNMPLVIFVKFDNDLMIR
jgi:hypothetical protein